MGAKTRAVAEDSNWWCCGTCEPWCCSLCEDWHCSRFNGEACPVTGGAREDVEESDPRPARLIQVPIDHPGFATRSEDGAEDIAGEPAPFLRGLGGRRIPWLGGRGGGSKE